MQLGPWFEFSLFVEWANGSGKVRRELNPYLRIGGFELCIDWDGVAVHLPSRSVGFIRGAGFWSRRKVSK